MHKFTALLVLAFVIASASAIAYRCDNNAALGELPNSNYFAAYQCPGPYGPFPPLDWNTIAVGYNFYCPYSSFNGFLNGDPCAGFATQATCNCAYWSQYKSSALHYIYFKWTWEPEQTEVMYCSWSGSACTSAFAYSCYLRSPATEWSAAQCAPTGPNCGNNIIESPELCDGTALNGMTCDSFTLPDGSPMFAGGTLRCGSGCSRWDTSMCNAIEGADTAELPTYPNCTTPIGPGVKIGPAPGPVCEAQGKRCKDSLECSWQQPDPTEFAYYRPGVSDKPYCMIWEGADVGICVECMSDQDCAIKGAGQCFTGLWLDPESGETISVDHQCIPTDQMAPKGWKRYGPPGQDPNTGDPGKGWSKWGAGGFKGWGFGPGIHLLKNFTINITTNISNNYTYYTTVNDSDVDLVNDTNDSCPYTMSSDIIYFFVGVNGKNISTPSGNISVSIPDNAVTGNTLMWLGSLEGNPSIVNASGCSIRDIDCDGITDDVDDCRWTYDPLQVDSDDDGLGNLCDPCQADDTNACANATNWNYTNPIPDGFGGGLMTFNGTTPLCGNVSWGNLSNLTLGNNYGIIRWRPPMNVTSLMRQPLPLNKFVNISHRFATVNGSTEMNKTALVTFYGIDCNRYRGIFWHADKDTDRITVLRTGQLCNSTIGPVCTAFRCDPENHSVSFWTDHWTGYAVGYFDDLSIWDENESFNYTPGTPVQFFANYSNITELPFKGQSCNITFYNGSTTTKFAMTEQTTFYNYSYTYNTPGWLNWSVKCNNLTAFDNAFYEYPPPSGNSVVAWDESDPYPYANVPIGPNMREYFFANYTTSLGVPVSTLDGDCKFALAPYTSYEDMHYNATKLLFELNRTLGCSGSYPWRVHCIAGADDIYYNGVALVGNYNATSVYRQPLDANVTSSYDIIGLVDGTLNTSGTYGSNASVFIKEKANGNFRVDFGARFCEGDVDLRNVSVFTTPSKTVVNLTFTSGITSTHALYVPVTTGQGVYVCPHATHLADLKPGCLDQVKFTYAEAAAGTNKTAGEMVLHAELNGTNYRVSGLTSTGMAEGTLTNLTIWDETDSFLPFGYKLRHTGNQTYFFANFTNSSGMPANTTDGGCRIDFQNPTYSGYRAMRYNTTYNIYTLNMTFSLAGTLNWKVNCSGMDSGIMENLETSDTVLILQGPHHIVPEFGTIAIVLALGIVALGMTRLRKR